MALARSAARREGVFGLVALVCVVADQATKALAVEYLSPGEAVPFIPGVLDLQLTWNSGAAFSLGEGLAWLFSLIALGVVAWLAWVLWRTRDLPIYLCVFAGVIAGGAIGNLIDRVCAGAVVDFLATAFMDFPIFNVADICVDVGVIGGFAAYLWWDGHAERGEAGE